MKNTFKTILLVLALGLGLANTEAALPLKNAQTETTVASTNGATNNSIVDQASITESKSVVATSKAAGGGKSKIIAALLAFFLGNFGVHSFYMGNTKKGLIQLVLGLGGIILYSVGIASAVTSGSIGFGGIALVGMIMLLAAGIWALVDFVRILIGSLEPESGFND
jgi:hypothetical protein